MLTKQNLSHLSPHMVNRLLHENQKSTPKFLSGKKLLKNVTLHSYHTVFWPRRFLCESWSGASFYSKQKVGAVDKYINKVETNARQC